MGTTTKPHYATVYDIPERPNVPVPKLPLLRYEDRPTTDGSGVSEDNCLTGYGETTVSDLYEVVDAGEDGQKRRASRLRPARPSSKHQTEATRADVDPVSTSGSDGQGEPPLTVDSAEQLEPEYFRDVINRASADDSPLNPNTAFRAFFENLRNDPRPRRRQRTLVLQNSPASEAIDARPRSN